MVYDENGVLDPTKFAPAYETKDSGKRAEYASGMVRDTEEGKARFDLLLPKGIPYAKQMLTRFADLMARGLTKYGARNWERANDEEELERYRSSALRHLVQWATGETDEDHAAAVMFNILAAETVKEKMEPASDDSRQSKHTPGTARKCCPPGCYDCLEGSHYLPCYKGCADNLPEHEPAEEVTRKRESNCSHMYAQRCDKCRDPRSEIKPTQRDPLAMDPWSNEADIQPYKCTLTIPHRCRIHPDGILSQETVGSCCDEECSSCARGFLPGHVLQCNQSCTGCIYRSGRTVGL